MAQNDVKTNTSTQIRNFYSDTSYLNTKFYNTNLSFQFYPFLNKDMNGRNQYDLKAGQITTLDFEGAYALYNTIKDIINGRIQECNLTLKCANATLSLDRKFNGINYDTILSINKNNTVIPFKFGTTNIQVKENNNYINRTIESGLGALLKTIDGYLTGINSDRHLDKLTDEFVKAQTEANANNPNNSQNWNNNKFNNNYKKSYNNNGSNNYRRNSYNNNSSWNNQQPTQNLNPPKQQDFSTYQINN